MHSTDNILSSYYYLNICRPVAAMYMGSSINDDYTKID